MSGEPFEVVGVTGPRFHSTRWGDVAPAVWVPLSAADRLQGRTEAQSWLTGRGLRRLWVTGRLKPGVPMDRAEASVRRVAAELGELFPATHAGRTARLISNEIPENDAERAFSAEVMRWGALVAMAMVGLVLLIACANVANLQLTRAIDRRREVALRMSLGAGRGRVIRSRLVESVLLAVIGGALGAAIAVPVCRFLAEYMAPPLEFDPTIDFAIEWRTLTFIFVAAAHAGVLAAVWPAWRECGASPADTMEVGTGGSAKSPRVLDALVSTQVALGSSCSSPASSWAGATSRCRRPSRDSRSRTRPSWRWTRPSATTRWPKLPRYSIEFWTGFARCPGCEPSHGRESSR